MERVGHDSLWLFQEVHASGLLWDFASSPEALPQSLTHSILKLAQNTDRLNHDQGDADADPDRGGRRVPADANKTRAGGDDAEGNEIGEYIVKHVNMLTRKSICWFAVDQIPLRSGITFPEFVIQVHAVAVARRKRFLSHLNAASSKVGKKKIAELSPMVVVALRL